MSADRSALGAGGEALAARHLQRVGYQIVATRWRCASGEIDIVAEQGGDLVFIEVRTRHNADLDAALESISKTKQRRLMRLAEAYLALNHIAERPWRIDVVAVAFQHGAPPRVEIIENAVGW